MGMRQPRRPELGQREDRSPPRLCQRSQILQSMLTVGSKSGSHCKLQTITQGLEQNGNAKATRAETPPPREGRWGGTPTDSMLMSMSQQARRAAAGESGPSGPLAGNTMDGWMLHDPPGP